MRGPNRWDCNDLQVTNRVQQGLDPVSLVESAALLMFAMLAVSAVPAVRAARMDPIVNLGEDSRSAE
jgi:ABC-type antimicrobial peptide transport system permease subunit